MTSLHHRLPLAGGGPLGLLKAYNPEFLVITHLSKLWQPNTMSGDKATSEGDVIGFCTDLSGNGYHVTQGATPSKPTLRLDVQNGLPVMRFLSTGTWLESVAAQLIGDDGTCTAFCVAKMNTDTGNAHVLINHDDSGNRGFQLRFNPSLAVDSVAFNTAPTAFFDNGPAHGSAFVVASSVRRATEVEAYANGISSDGATTTTGTPGQPTARIGLGRFLPSGGGQADADIGAAAIFGYDMNTAEHADVVNIFNEMYEVF